MNDAQRLKLEGFSIDVIAERLGMHRATVYRRLREPEHDDDVPPGPVEQAMSVLIAGRKLDSDGQVIAAEAVALAAKVDQLSRSQASAAGLALASVSRRLEACRLQLERAPGDALTELQEQRARRLRENSNHFGNAV